jgi:hypothetical protein
VPPLADAGRRRHVPTSPSASTPGAPATRTAIRLKFTWDQIPAPPSLEPVGPHDERAFEREGVYGFQVTVTDRAGNSSTAGSCGGRSWPCSDRHRPPLSVEAQVAQRGARREHQPRGRVRRLLREQVAGPTSRSRRAQPVVLHSALGGRYTFRSPPAAASSVPPAR